MVAINPARIIEGFTLAKKPGKFHYHGLNPEHLLLHFAQRMKIYSDYGKIYIQIRDVNNNISLGAD